MLSLQKIGCGSAKLSKLFCVHLALSLQKIGCGSAKLSKLFCIHLALSLQKIGCTLAFRASSIPNESINYSISDTNDDTQDAPPGSPLPVPRGRSCRGATEDRKPEQQLDVQVLSPSRQKQRTEGGPSPHVEHHRRTRWTLRLQARHRQLYQAVARTRKLAWQTALCTVRWCQLGDRPLCQRVSCGQPQGWVQRLCV